MHAGGLVTVLAHAARDERRFRFERLALPLQGELWRTALRLTGNSADAEDLVQEAYLKAFHGFDRFRAGTAFRSWIFTVLKNVFIDDRRKARRRPAPVDPNVIEVQPAADAAAGRTDPVTDWDEETVRNHFDDDVSRALLRLGPAFRSAFLLACVGGWSYHEIAAAMQCPVGTVRSRVARARASLRDELAGVTVLSPQATSARSRSGTRA